MKNRKTRRGATAVEFALVAPVFLLCLFACIDFARFWMTEAIVENAVFQTARHVSVFGATEADAREYAQQELSYIGISEFEIEIAPFANEQRQTVIDDGTTTVQVQLTVPASELTMFSRFFSNAPLVRSTAKQTNRPS